MITVDCSLTLTTSGVESDESLRDEVGRIMEQLLLLEDCGCGIRDAAVSLDLHDQTVMIELVSEAQTFEDARRTADSSVRSAIHAAGGNTPNWRYQTTESIQRTHVVDHVDA